MAITRIPTQKRSIETRDKIIANEMARFKVSLRLGIYLIFIYNVVSIRMQQ